MIPHDVDGDAEGDPENELCNTVSSDDQADRGSRYGECEEVRCQERNVDVLGEPEESGDGAQERFLGLHVSFGVRVVVACQQNTSSYHILLPRSYVRSSRPQGSGSPTPSHPWPFSEAIPRRPDSEGILDTFPAEQLDDSALRGHHCHKKSTFRNAPYCAWFVRCLRRIPTGPVILMRPELRRHARASVC